MHVSQDDLRRWNGLDPSARLQEGMTLQARARETDLSNVVVASEADVQVLTWGRTSSCGARAGKRLQAGDGRSEARRYD